jgi:hypothetical protein
MTQDLDKIATQAHIENRVEMVKVLELLRNAIDNNEMPSPKELLQNKKNKKKPSDSIKRPSNSNIIYTNQLGKFGLLTIIRKFCDKHGINKQKLVPISKKISKILWKELSTVHQKFFEQLASEVKKEHEKMYPNYKYRPKRKPSNYTKFKQFDPNDSKTKTTDCTSSPMNNISFADPVSSQEYHEDEELDEDIFEDLDLSEDELPDGYPKFHEEPPSTPLEINYGHSPSSLEVNYDETSSVSSTHNNND